MTNKTKPHAKMTCFDYVIAAAVIVLACATVFIGICWVNFWLVIIGVAAMILPFILRRAYQWRAICGLALAYFLTYSVLSVFGCYQPFTVDINRVMDYSWAPLGFYDPNHAWEGSSYAVHHPTEKTGGWRDSMMWAFVPLWLLDCQFIHNGKPPDDKSFYKKVWDNENNTN